MTLHFDFQALPSEAQEAYWKFQEDRGFSRFAIDLQRLLLNHKIDSFLHQCPAFLLAVAELFDEKHPQLGLRELCEGMTGPAFQTNSLVNITKSKDLPVMMNLHWRPALVTLAPGICREMTNQMLTIPKGVGL